MLNTDDSQSIEWFIDEKIKPLKKQIKKLQLDNKELKEKFSLYAVSHRRELLLDFLKWQSTAYGCSNNLEGNSKEIDLYLKSNNCG
jgi:hypothetical protein